MSTVADALAGLRAAFLTITPPVGVDLGSRVWAWPADRASVEYDTFPFILCGQVLSENGVWRPHAQGVGFHSWPAEVLICLNRETQRDDVSADDEEDAQAWLYAAAAVLFDDQGLGGAAFSLGGDDGLLTTRIGNMGWLGPSTVFWGVYVRVMVHQIQSLPSI